MDFSVNDCQYNTSSCVDPLVSMLRHCMGTSLISTSATRVSFLPFSSFTGLNERHGEKKFIVAKVAMLSDFYHIINVT